MDKERDIHDFQRRMDSIVRAITTSQLSEENKKALLDFDRAMQLSEQLSLPRREKLLRNLFILARRYFGNDLLHLTTDQIKDCIRSIESSQGSPWTCASYKVTIKKWCRWLAYGDEIAHTKEVPKIVSWITIHVKRKDEPRVQASSILTEEEIRQLIGAAQHPRDRAFISMLYETGARIGEMGWLNVGSVARDNYSFKIDLSGKTGHRTPRIVMSDPYLTHWLEQHPFNKNPDAPLWITLEGREKGKRMEYSSLRALVRRIAERAGIKKRIYPHLFRHTRVTHLLSKRLINEAQAKVYFGWTPDSQMLSTYSHLASEDVNDAILELNGIKVQRSEQQEPQTRICPRCTSVNSREAIYCLRCSGILDQGKAFSMDAVRSTDELLNLIIRDPEVQKVIMERLKKLDVAELKSFLPRETNTNGLQIL